MNTVRTVRATAWCFAAAALSGAFIVYAVYVFDLGFPDGHVSELADAQRNLAYLFILASAGLAPAFLALAVAKTPRPQWVALACVVYLLVAAGAWLLDEQLIRTLPGGAGG